MSTVPGEEPLEILGGGVPPGSPNLHLILDHITSTIQFNARFTRYDFISKIHACLQPDLASQSCTRLTNGQHTVEAFFNHDYLKVAVTHLKLKRQIRSYACVVRIPMKTISDGQKSTPPLQLLWGQNSVPLWGGTCPVYSLYRGLAYPPEGIA